MKKVKDIEEFLESGEVEGIDEYGDMVSSSIINISLRGAIICSIISTILLFFNHLISPLVAMEIGLFTEVFVSFAGFSLAVFLIVVILYKRNPGFWKNIDERKSLKRYYSVNNVYDVITFIFNSLACIYLVLMFVITPTTVKGPSMENNFYDNDKILVLHLLYNEPQRGDIVVADATNYVDDVYGFGEEKEELYIKRVIGIPGDTIRCDGEFLYVNGIKASEDYIASISNPCRSGDVFTVTLLQGEYYLMGDNRLVSSDSRIFGPVKLEDILGRVVIRIFPNFSTFW